MVLLADDDTERGTAAAADIETVLLAADCTVVVRQAGTALRSEAGNGLEHFGYVDGRSQPLMLLEDIEAESRDEGIAHWDPTAKLSRALVADPLANDPEGLSFGSFFIFRKLEQNVLGFKTKEQDLANTLKLVGAERRELAGALLVGRFEDGTPVTLSDEARNMKRPRNDFNYDADGVAARCPFHAHIRKTNPRGSSGATAQEKELEQACIMARRGITYEDTPRKVHPEALPEAETKAEFLVKVAPLLPTGGLGLLFMAYNAELDNQFVLTQKGWANERQFPKVPSDSPFCPPGLDGIIGQPADGTDTHFYAAEWDQPTGAPIQSQGFNGFVTMRGGEYFFAPSLKFLRGL